MRVGAVTRVALAGAQRYVSCMATPDTAALAEMIVQDVHGQSVRFGSAWQSQPALFLFLRHFG